MVVEELSDVTPNCFVECLDFIQSACRNVVSGWQPMNTKNKQTMKHTSE